MLVLKRRIGQQILIGTECVIELLDITRIIDEYKVIEIAVRYKSNQIYNLFIPLGSEILIGESIWIKFVAGRASEVTIGVNSEGETISRLDSGKPLIPEVFENEDNIFEDILNRYES